MLMGDCGAPTPGMTTPVVTSDPEVWEIRERASSVMLFPLPVVAATRPRTSSSALAQWARSRRMMSRMNAVMNSHGRTAAARQCSSWML